MNKIDVISATFDGIADRVRDQPLHVQSEGTDVAVVLSPERYQELLMKGVNPNVRPAVVELSHASIKKHSAIYRALAEMEKKFDQ